MSSTNSIVTVSPKLELGVFILAKLCTTHPYKVDSFYLLFYSGAVLRTMSRVACESRAASRAG